MITHRVAIATSIIFALGLPHAQAGNDGINRLISVSTTKADAANEDAASAPPPPKPQTRRQPRLGHVGNNAIAVQGRKAGEASKEFDPIKPAKTMSRKAGEGQKEFATGQPAKVTARKAGKPQQEYMTIKMNEVFITKGSPQQGGSKKGPLGGGLLDGTSGFNQSAPSAAGAPAAAPAAPAGPVFR
jgi:hypothetical protein